MTRHTYSDATTKRYVQWRSACVLGGDCEPPRLGAIERWLREEEEYRDPLTALRNLCVGLRESDMPSLLQQIACALIPALEEEREFSAKAEGFFSAAIRRVGVDDDEVRIHDDGFRKVCTLHDLGLAKRETDHASHVPE